MLPAQMFKVLSAMRACWRLRWQGHVIYCFNSPVKHSTVQF